MSWVSPWHSSLSSGNGCSCQSRDCQVFGTLAGSVFCGHSSTDVGRQGLILTSCVAHIEKKHLVARPVCLSHLSLLSVFSFSSALPTESQGSTCKSGGIDRKPVHPRVQSTGPPWEAERIPVPPSAARALAEKKSSQCGGSVGFTCSPLCSEATSTLVLNCHTARFKELRRLFFSTGV